MKTEILDSVMEVVADVCEISKEQICSKCKENDVVDARCIFTYHCRKLGLPAVTIAKYLGRKKNESIRILLANHDIYSRQSLSYRLMNWEVTKKIDKIFAQSN